MSTVKAPIVFTDTETDGVHPGRQAWEVAMIRREPDGTERETAFFVDVDLSTADPFGLQVGRFYERHPVGRFIARDAMYARDARPPRAHRDSPSFKTRAEAAAAVAQWTHGAHVVGAIPSFDTFTLDPLLREHGLIPSWHYHIVDVEALAVGFLNGSYVYGGAGSVDPRLPIHPPYKSDDLSFMLGLTPPSDEDRHTALGDARFARAMYDVVMGERARNGARSTLFEQLRAAGEAVRA